MNANGIDCQGDCANYAANEHSKTPANKLGHYFFNQNSLHNRSKER
jgi:hypothetical protein